MEFVQMAITANVRALKIFAVFMTNQLYVEFVKNIEKFVIAKEYQNVVTYFAMNVYVKM